MSVVQWEDSARDELADVWVTATPAERDTIARIVESLERDLARDPLDVGESRTGRIRVEIRPPLVIWFDVSADESVVRIIRIARPPAH